MTIYRVEKQPWYVQYRLPLAGAGILLLVLLAGAILWRGQEEASREPEAVLALKESAQGLEVFAIEYPQAGEGVERQGAEAVLGRALARYEEARPWLAARDPQVEAELSALLAQVQTLVEAHASPEEVVPLVEQARDQLLQVTATGGAN
ncbi:hypothetical protein FKZ61_015105 [Litorilinea aerophila]|uniref:Uncharacterized protein n=1 Tax=Litorilinea aerophila TaxID=1204385 RepID=A0A540VD99_9CHLR|nr:hypothetical protein [Litorilinea aerophila]MCC9077429.1 hypothetical protein [Litorilinea aerophila]OUC06107.1 hypothetical protein RY27_23070 [Litorilinea aerophila]GIV77598.1 MAG: hypothetical protein KatS3mg050_1992 [Litorilinea sp.]